jgi:hypothetical protein
MNPAQVVGEDVARTANAFGRFVVAFAPDPVTVPPADRVVAGTERARRSTAGSVDGVT